MNILAMDTSGDVLSLVLSSSRGKWGVEIDAGTRHSELLMEWIDKLFCSAGLEPGDLELVACMKGPGSFTGLRIGFAAAKGLSLALGIPMVAVPTLDCLSCGLSVWPGLVLPVMDAKKNCFYAALYRGGSLLTEYMDADPETIIRTLEHHRIPGETAAITGPGAELFLSRLDKLGPAEGFSLDPQFFRGKAFELLKFIENRDIIDTDESDIYSGPLYLRKSDAELNLKS